MRAVIEGLGIGMAVLVLVVAGLTVACRRPSTHLPGEDTSPFTVLYSDRFGHYQLLRVEATGECFFVADRGSGVAVSPARCTR